jgi:hypothetical protein
MGIGRPVEATSTRCPCNWPPRQERQHGDKRSKSTNGKAGYPWQKGQGEKTQAGQPGPAAQRDPNQLVKMQPDTAIPAPQDSSEQVARAMPQRASEHLGVARGEGRVVNQPAERYQSAKRQHRMQGWWEACPCPMDPNSQQSAGESSLWEF